VGGMGNTQFVWLLDDGVARRRDVTLGATADGKVEIRAGLTGGETVLLPDGQPLSEGQAVRVRSKASVVKKPRRALG